MTQWTWRQWMWTVLAVAVPAAMILASSPAPIAAASPTAEVETAPAAAAAEQTRSALHKYVAKADDSYGWKKIREYKVGDADAVELILTSQNWQNIRWRHQLFIIKPKTVKRDSDHAFLMIEGGRWRDELADANRPRNLPKEAPVFAALAEQLQTPLAVLLQVPQQPIFDGKVEDAAIAYTFEQFLRTQNDEWPLLLPMVKSAVRGMDATTEFCATEWDLEIDSYTVAGASKRGWTTWLTAAIDPRVSALAPMVIDMLNMEAQMKNQLATWGGYSDQIHDYTERGLQQHLGSPGGRALREIVDPFSYRQALKQPKLIILGTNDPYWPLDSLNLYWNELRGDKYVLYVPNNVHGLKDYPRILGSIAALHRREVEGTTLPDLDWKFTPVAEGVQLAMTTDIAPQKVRAWIASSRTRDFRQATWLPIDLTLAADADKSLYTMPIPKSGYSAIFGEWQFEGKLLPYFLSTNVEIIPSVDAKQADAAVPTATE